MDMDMGWDGKDLVWVFFFLLFIFGRRDYPLTSLSRFAFLHCFALRCCSDLLSFSISSPSGPSWRCRRFLRRFMISAKSLMTDLTFIPPLLGCIKSFLYVTFLFFPPSRGVICSVFCTNEVTTIHEVMTSRVNDRLRISLLLFFFLSLS